MTEQEQIAAFIAAKGVTKCETAVAYRIGASTPGFAHRTESIARFVPKVRGEMRESFERYFLNTPATLSE